MTQQSPFLTINAGRPDERTIARWDAAPASTSLARIDPDAITREALSANAGALSAYLRAIAPRMDTDDDDRPRSNAGAAGLSTADELTARNRRFFVTIAGLSATAAAATWGIVAIAADLGVIDHAWTMPAWIAATGLVAFLSIRWVHSDEIDRSPEGIALVGANAAAYASEVDAESRRLIAAAYASAVEADAESRRTDAAGRLAATEAEIARMGRQQQQQRSLAAPRQVDAGMMLTYATQIPRPDAQEARHDAEPPIMAALPIGAAARPYAPDPGLVALTEELTQLFEDYHRTGSDLITRRLSWSQRGAWPAEQKRRAAAALGMVQPPIVIAGAGGRYRFNPDGRSRNLCLAAVRGAWRLTD